MSNAMPALTLQQLRVVLQLAEGCSYKNVALHLGISIPTVKLHVARVAYLLPGDGPAKSKVLRYADRLICAQSIDLITRAKAA